MSKYTEESAKVIDPNFIDSVKSKYASLSFRDMALKYKDLQSKIDDIKKSLREITAEFDVLRLDVIPDKMDQENISSVNLPGVGRLGVSLDMYVTIKAADRDEFYNWLQREGHGDIIKPYAQPGTVKALLKELVKEGNVVPEDIATVTPFYRASVTKA